MRSPYPRSYRILNDRPFLPPTYRRTTRRFISTGEEKNEVLEPHGIRK